MKRFTDDPEGLDAIATAAEAEAEDLHQKAIASMKASEEAILAWQRGHARYIKASSRASREWQQAG